MAAPRNALQKAADRQRVSEMYLEKRTINEIARTLGINRHTVAADIRWVQAQWALQHPGEYKAKMAEELARIDLIELKAWECFERSVGLRRTSRTRLSTTARGQISMAESREEDMIGDPAYLRLVLGCVDQRAKILGFYAPRRLEIEEHIEDELDREELVRTIEEELELLDERRTKGLGLGGPEEPMR